MKKRQYSGDYRVCAAHDLAPIFESTFGIDPELLASNDDFLRILGESGLKLKGEAAWTTLSQTKDMKGKK